jgi:hypothetical protein
MAAYSVVLWLLRKHAPQNIALFVSLIVTICATIATIAHGNAPSLAFTVALWSFGLMWVLAGWRRWVEPMWASVPLGTWCRTAVRGRAADVGMAMSRRRCREWARISHLGAERYLPTCRASMAFWWAVWAAG